MSDHVEEIKEIYERGLRQGREAHLEILERGLASMRSLEGRPGSFLTGAAVIFDASFLENNSALTSTPFLQKGIFIHGAYVGWEGERGGEGRGRIGC